MGLSDKFRINELANKGSKVIKREDSSGTLLVQKKDNKQVPPSKKNKPFVPFGQKPIKGKQISPKYKSDWVDTDEFNTIPDGQESFAGETSGYLEKPKYNEEELQKAIDVKVDELIKKQKAKKVPYIRLSKYNKLWDNFNKKISELEDLTIQLEEQISKNEELQSKIDSINVRLDAAKLQQAAAENETQASNDRHTTLLTNFQQSLVKGTKEGIERVSLTAQVRGLQAQKITLDNLLKAQRELTKAATAQTEALASQITAQQSQIAGAAAETTAVAAGLVPFPGNEAFYGITQTGEWTEYDISWTTAAKGTRRPGNGGVFKLQNLRDDKAQIIALKVKNITGHLKGYGPFGFGSDDGKPSATTGAINIEQGSMLEIPFFFNKSIGGNNNPAPKKKWITWGSARDYDGQFKLEVKFSDNTTQTSSQLSYKIRKNKG